VHGTRRQERKASRGGFSRSGAKPALPGLFRLHARFVFWEWGLIVDIRSAILTIGWILSMLTQGVRIHESRYNASSTS
jgi:hypothetical protein